MKALQGGTSETFENQFKRRVKIKVMGEIVHIIDIKPKILKSTTPILIAPGWANTPIVFKDSLKGLSKLGRRVITVDHSKIGQNIKLIDNYSEAELRKALSIIAALDKLGISKIDAVGYSEGGINVVLAASLSPQRFRNIILLNPAGMIGKTSFFELFKRFSIDIVKTSVASIINPPIKNNVDKSVKSFLNYFIANPARALKECMEISKTDIRKKIKELKSKGIGISVIHSLSDEVFPIKQDHIKKYSIDKFYTIQGNHVGIISHPEKYIGLIIEALNYYENKK